MRKFFKGFLAAFVVSLVAVGIFVSQAPYKVDAEETSIDITVEGDGKVVAMIFDGTTKDPEQFTVDKDNPVSLKPDMGDVVHLEIYNKDKLESVKINDEKYQDFWDTQFDYTIARYRVDKQKSTASIKFGNSNKKVKRSARSSVSLLGDSGGAGGSSGSGGTTGLGGVSWIIQDNNDNGLGLAGSEGAPNTGAVVEAMRRMGVLRSEEFYNMPNFGAVYGCEASDTVIARDLANGIAQCRSNYIAMYGSDKGFVPRIVAVGCAWGLQRGVKNFNGGAFNNVQQDWISGWNSASQNRNLTLYHNDYAYKVDTAFHNSSQSLTGFALGQLSGANRLRIIVLEETQPIGRTGKVKIQKSSANTAVTDNNPCYSLEGAQYGLYKDSGCTDQVGTFTINADGSSNQIENLSYQTYYIKEIKAPGTYDLDTTVYSADVNSSDTVIVDVKEKPTMPQPPALVSKQDYETGSKPQGSATFKGAEFTIKYYKDYLDNPTGTPAKTWVMRTNEQGIIELKSQYKVSGDDFYYDNGVPVLPYGTITIQETKAPNGYHLDNTVIVKQNKPSSNFNTVTVKDLITRLKLVKVQSGNKTGISGSKFKHTLPNGSTETVTTGNNGEVVLNGLQVGIHKLVETYAPDGYDINTTEIVFEVTNEGDIRLRSNPQELGKMGITVALDSESNASATVEDKVSPFDLKINKVNEKGKKLAGAEFTLYSDANCTKALQRFETDDEGVLTFSDLQTETTYYFKETKAPKGYRIPVDSNGNVHVYEVRVDSTPQNNVFNFTVDGVDYTVNNVNINDPVHLEGTKKDRVVSVQVINFTGNKLPITGDDGTIQMLVSGGVVLSGLLLIVLKRKRSVA